MKRVLCIMIAVAVICLMAGCNFTTNFSDSMGVTSAESIPEVEAMLQALAEEDMDAALERMHPNVAVNCRDAVDQMCDYLNGRSVSQLTQQSVRVNTSTGSAGKIRQEVVQLHAVLDDGTVIYISAAYRTDSDGEGFVSFQLVLGVV